MITLITDRERELMAQVDALKAEIDKLKPKSLAECRVGLCDCDSQVETCDQCAPFLYPKAVQS